MESVKQFLVLQRQKAALLTLVVSTVLLAHYLPEALLISDWNVSSAVPRWHSLFYAGLPIWTEVIVAAELFLLFSRFVWKSNTAQMGHVSPFHRAIILIALVWTFFSNWNFWTIWQQHIADSGQLIIYLPAASALVSCAGLALAVLIAKQLDFVWKGYGFWILYTINYALAIPKEISLNAHTMMNFNLGRTQIVLILLIALIPILAAVLTTTLSMANRENDNRSQIFLWMLAYFGSTWITLGLIDLQNGHVLWLAANNTRHYFALILQAIIIVVIGTTIYFRLNSRDERLAHISALLLSTAALYLLAINNFRLGFLAGPNTLVAAWAALELQGAWKNMRKLQVIKRGIKTAIV